MRECLRPFLRAGICRKCLACRSGVCPRQECGRCAAKSSAEPRTPEADIAVHGLIKVSALRTLRGGRGWGVVALGSMRVRDADRQPMCDSTSFLRKI